MRFFFASALFALALFYPGSAPAAEIQGRVLNAQGGAIAGAKVTATSPDGRAVAEATTGPDGSYSLSSIAPGSYVVNVLVPGGGGTLRRQVALPQGSKPVRADFQVQGASASIAAEERNPNIFVYRIDLNDLRNRLTVGRGSDPTYVSQFSADQNYFGSEYGAPLFSYEVLRPRALVNAWRGSVYALHQNSPLNARNFFNVGPLRPSRSTSYSLTGNGPLPWEGTSLLLQFGQTLTSGAVNGNIQGPTLAERSQVLATDPARRAIVSSLLQAYPLEEPNLGGHRLNSNAPRNIDSKDALGRVDWKQGENNSYAFRYTVSDYSEDPFQLVAGQNPQTDVRTQGAYLSLTRTLSPSSVARFAFNFDRTGASLLPTKRFSSLFSGLGIASVPDIDFQSDAYNDIGPGTQFPRMRVQNRFQLFGDWSRSFGMHSLKAGWSMTRQRLNDLQSDTSRGVFKFSRDAVCTATPVSEIENFLRGCPSAFTISLGDFYRGFRNWEHFGFVEDTMKVTPTFTASLGLRYELMTAPYEVNNLTQVNMHTDKDNFAPRIGLAWNPRRGKSVIRAAYGVSYSSIMGVSYGMTRFNPPANQVVQVSAPDLANPLAGFSTEPTPGARTSLFQLSPDLISAYSHQYTFSIERSMPWTTTVRIAYIGSRTFHLLTQQVHNRALPSTTLPNTTATVNLRRPDPRYFDISVIESNANSYYDAVQISADKRLSNGLTFRALYTFGKNIDTGGDFTNTATGVEKPPETGTPSCEICDHVSDHKGVSLFDTPQAFLVTYSYTIPFRFDTRSWLQAALSGWQVSGTTIFQSGTPFHFHTGSDGAGVGNVDGWPQDRPNVLDPTILHTSLDDPDKTRCQVGVPTEACPSVSPKFDTLLPVGGRGNLGFNTFRKDGTANWNLAIGRTFRLPGGQERALQFRAEFINLFNTAQFDKPGVNVASDTFGEITNTANKGRQVQFSLRLNF